jgi:catechol 2,3-dioxygenase-like lactoylglutathione lyase family enzyme
MRYHPARMITSAAYFSKAIAVERGLWQGAHKLVVCLLPENAMLQLFHVGLTVKNLQRSLAFYRDIAGMEAGEVFHGESPEFDTLTNNPGARLCGVHLKAGAFMLQLLEYEAGGGTTLDLHHNNVGSPHLCFYVPDVEAKYTELQQRGDVRITSEIVPIMHNMRSFYTEDPDGVPVEFLQYTA